MCGCIICCQEGDEEELEDDRGSGLQMDDVITSTSTSRTSIHPSTATNNSSMAAPEPSRFGPLGVATKNPIQLNFTRAGKTDKTGIYVYIYMFLFFSYTSHIFTYIF